MVLKESRVQLAGHLRRLFCRVWLRIRKGEEKQACLDT